MAIKEKCTQEQFEALHAALDKVRSTSTTVTVSKEALKNLLIDHGQLQTLNRQKEAA